MSPRPSLAPSPLRPLPERLPRANDCHCTGRRTVRVEGGGSSICSNAAVTSGASSACAELMARACNSGVEAQSKCCSTTLWDPNHRCYDAEQNDCDALVANRRRGVAVPAATGRASRCCSFGSGTELVALRECCNQSARSPVCAAHARGEKCWPGAMPSGTLTASTLAALPRMAELPLSRMAAQVLFLLHAARD